MPRRPELTLYPGEEIYDKADFTHHAVRFEAPPTTRVPSERWHHDDMLRYLLGHTSIRSAAGEVIGKSDDAMHFANELEVAKRDATIHLPGSDYAIPEWAHQFEDTIHQVVEYEHQTNPRANQQIVQIRCRQHREQPRNIHPHMDMVNSNVRNFHFYLTANHSPTTTYDGTFTYEPHPYDTVHEDPLEFYRDLDRQFAHQIGNIGINAVIAEPFDIQVLHTQTVHKPPETMPIGRTLLAVQFYETR